MSFLDALAFELGGAGIPARRRRRILAEFADHLRENPEAELGEPRALARQFADELGTRLARATAYRAFVALAVAAVALAAMFLAGGRSYAWAAYDGADDALPGYTPMLILCVLAAQIALAAGTLGAIRAWRLRRRPVISCADAVALNRRAAVGLIAGAITMLVMPLTFIAFRAWAAFDSLAYPRERWFAMMLVVGSVAVIGLLSLLPSVRTAMRLRPSLDGEPRDITADIGIDDPRVTPWRVAWVLSGLLLVVVTLLGVAADDPYDGLARGLLEAGACLGGFAVLGGYLSLRATR